MSNILAISAKKSGGKTTATNFIFGLEMLSLGLVEYFKINPKGRLVVPQRFDDGTENGRIEDLEFDPLTANTQEKYEFMATNLWPEVKQYNFADPLKKGVCMGILGLTYEQCYGIDEEKNAPTHLKWEDMPGVITEKQEDILKVVDDSLKASAKKVEGRLGKYYEIINGLVYHPPGLMSCREVMQFIGTEIFRKMYGNVWVEALVRQINAEGTNLALIGDCRFPNEVFGTQKAGGKVIRFTRNPYPEDKHPSEVALDEENFDWKNFDGVLDNKDMDINTQNQELHKLLAELGVLPYELKVQDDKYVTA
jgi:hypothetical protein